MAKLTVKQQKFCDLYIELGNATEAAIRAGYSKKTAFSIGIENLKKPYIKNYIDEKMQEISSSKIASAEEVMKLLTSTMRGEIQEEVVVVENMGDKSSEARIVNKQVSAKERIKAAELLGKRHQLFTDKISVEGAVPVVIMDDLEE